MNGVLSFVYGAGQHSGMHQNKKNVYWQSVLITYFTIQILSEFLRMFYIPPHLQTQIL